MPKDVPQETAEEIERVGRATAGSLQAEEVVGFYQTLRKGGIPKALAGEVLLVWLRDYGNDEGCGCGIIEVEP